MRRYKNLTTSQSEISCPAQARPRARLRKSAGPAKNLSVRNTRRKLPPVGSHQWIDAINLAIARAIARKIRREPRLYNRARRTLARWERVKRACPPPLREWKQILTTQSRERVL